LKLFQLYNYGGGHLDCQVFRAPQYLNPALHRIQLRSIASKKLVHEKNLHREACQTRKFLVKDIINK